MITFQNILEGETPTISPLASYWNENQFCLDPAKPCGRKTIIHEEREVTRYGTSIPGETVLVRHQYAIANDKYIPPRILLLARNIASPTLEEWSPVGELYNGAIGIMAAYRGKGAGTAFFEALLAKGIRFDPYFSPKGYDCLKKAFASLCKKFPKKYGPIESIEATAPFIEKRAA